MNRIHKKLSAIFIATSLISGCSYIGNGSSLDKKNVNSVEKATTSQVTSQIRDVTSSAASTSHAKTEALK